MRFHSISFLWMLTLILLEEHSTCFDNLVPNPGFEDVNYDYCGLFPSVEAFELSNKHWTVPTLLRPEIVSETISKTCWNYAGFGTKPRSGQRAAVILLYSENNSRSYLQVRLTKPLVKGKNYYTQVFVKPDYKVDLACNNLGLYFSDTILREKRWDILNFIPQVNHNTVLSDTSNWVSLTARFKATSCANYLIIGNFLAGQDTEIMVLNRSDSKFQAAWYLLDDICVREDGVSY